MASKSGHLIANLDSSYPVQQPTGEVEATIEANQNLAMYHAEEVVSNGEFSAVEFGFFIMGFPFAT